MGKYVNSLVDYAKSITGYDITDLLLDYIDMCAEKGASAAETKRYLKLKTLDYVKFCEEVEI